MVSVNRVVLKSNKVVCVSNMVEILALAEGAPTNKVVPVEPTCKAAPNCVGVADSGPLITCASIQDNSPVVLNAAYPTVYGNIESLWRGVAFSCEITSTTRRLFSIKARTFGTGSTVALPATGS